MRWFQKRPSGGEDKLSGFRAAPAQPAHDGLFTPSADERPLGEVVDVEARPTSEEVEHRLDLQNASRDDAAPVGGDAGPHGLSAETPGDGAVSARPSSRFSIRRKPAADAATGGIDALQPSRESREAGSEKSAAQSEAGVQNPLPQTGGAAGFYSKVGRKKAGLKASGGSRRLVKHLPIKVLIGFLPEVTQRDALSYAMGVAEKHFESLDNAFYEVYPISGGFVYEAHEGGEGVGFVPEVLKYFDAAGPFDSSREDKIHIRTATRTVEVLRKSNGLEALLLPESAPIPQSPQALASEVMRPAFNKRAGLLYAGAAVFITGFFASLLIGSFMRTIPDMEVPPAPVERPAAADLPAGQWLKLLAVPEGRYVKALRYDARTKWAVDTGDKNTDDEASQSEAPDADARQAQKQEGKTQ